MSRTHKEVLQLLLAVRLFVRGPVQDTSYQNANKQEGGT